MKARNANTYGPWTKETYWGGVFPRTDGRRRYNYCAPGPIVAGNRRDPNTWYYSARKIDFDPGRDDTVYYGWSGEAEASYGWLPGRNEPYMPSWSSYRDAVYNTALGRFNDRLRGVLDLSVSIAEAGQTVKMLKNLAKIRDLLQNHWGDPRYFGGGSDLANGWLQFQYGWKPLMSDLFGILNQMLETNLATIRTVRASATLPVEYRGPGSDIAPTHYVPMKNYSWGKASCRFVASYEVGGQNLSNWTSLNPLSLGWELIPYSFVVDWFYDVGNFLRATETALLYDVNFIGGYVSELFAVDGDEELALIAQDFPSSNPAHSHTYSGFGCHYRKREFARTVLTSHPLPRPPMFKADLGSEQLLSLAALLAQLL